MSSRQLVPRAAKMKATEALASMETDDGSAEGIAIPKKPNKLDRGYKMDIPDVVWDATGSYVLPASEFATPVTAEVHGQILKEYRTAMGGDNMRRILCAVCSRFELVKYACKIDIGTFERQYRDHCTPDFALPDISLLTHAEFPMLNGMLIEERGIVEDTSRGLCAMLCNACATRGTKHHCPPCSLANGTWVGTVPECLKDLSFCEEVLISQTFMRGIVLTLTSSTGGARQHGFKGNVISFPMKPDSTAAALTSLPRHLSNLTEIIEIHFYGPPMQPSAFTQPSTSTRKVLTVRRQVVRTALEWLKANNVLYRDVVVDDAVLATYPDDSIPDSCWLSCFQRTAISVPATSANGASAAGASVTDTATSANGARATGASATENVIERDGYASVGQDDDSGTGDQGILMSGIVDSNGTGVDARAVRNMALQSLLQVGVGSQPINEYEYTARLFAGAFPTLFPYGIGAPGFKPRESQSSAGYKVALSFDDHVKYLIEFSDNRFASMFSTFPFTLTTHFITRSIYFAASLTAIIQVTSSSLSLVST